MKVTCLIPSSRSILFRNWSVVKLYNPKRFISPKNANEKKKQRKGKRKKKRKRKRKRKKKKKKRMRMKKKYGILRLISQVLYWLKTLMALVGIPKFYKSHEREQNFTGFVAWITYWFDFCNPFIDWSEGCQERGNSMFRLGITIGTSY